MEGSTNMKGGNQDRISCLPDFLLHLIMSFLTAHEAVQMCVLSKRWKNLWTTLPFLNFDLPALERDMSGSDSEDDEPEDYYQPMFVSIVNMTLLLREPTDLLKFRLSCSEIPNGLYNRFICSWIRYPLNHNPQVLDIDISQEDPLPLGLFTCASLVDLKLFCSYIDPPTVVNLPCIKRLHLGRLNLSQNFMKELLCGCPVLESLQLELCNMQFSTIRSQSMKYIKIENQHPDCGTSTVMELINAPNLLSFHYTGCARYIGHNVLLNMPSLRSATICMDRCNSHPSYNGNSKILTGISSVKNIKLSGFWIKEQLENGLPKVPMFQNVENLTVDDLCLKCNFNLLASFLEHFPNMKILSLWHASYKCEVEVHGNEESLEIAPFKCTQLHTVNVKFFKGDNNTHWLMKYLLFGTENLRAKINMTSMDGCHRYC